MKLYDVPNNTLIKMVPYLREDGKGITEETPSVFESVRVPPGAPNVSVNQYLHFYHVDGMYSLCKDMDGEVCHVAAWTEVEPVEWSYENMALLRTIIKRGGHGKNGDEQVNWVLTRDMDDEWLDNCIVWEETHRPQNHMIEFYKWERKYRDANEIKV